jgi:hypothetical protein
MKHTQEYFDQRAIEISKNLLEVLTAMELKGFIDSDGTQLMGELERYLIHMQ